MAVDDIIYIKPAVGKKGKRIKIFKLTTMHPGSDKEFLDLRRTNGVDGLGKIVNDHRIIKGRERWRKLWIDEIPKMLNLIKGDLRLVGICPRPEGEWEDLPAEHKEAALQYRPGLLPVHYAEPTKNYQESIQLEVRYLEEKKANPFLTDIKYFGKIVWNIVINGVRSK